ncbi:multiple PDZ domain protein [Elysia marginata]|uniref:Multiple PDZ domain protein n=1 Tax=Elysia marginata TaxID=1093978 RepID=A0AAV4JN40_9GAST|nr:multiple PDZ domain protein [Elysia marginata]
MSLCLPPSMACDHQHGGRSGLSQRKAVSGSPSPSDQVNPSDLNNAVAAAVSTPPASPRHHAGSPASPSPLSGHAQTITIHKDNQHLGLTLEAVDKAVNGCAVKTIARPSAAHVDGRLQPGDLILSVNNESLKRITSAQARAILRRCSLLGSDIRQFGARSLVETRASGCGPLVESGQAGPPGMGPNHLLPGTRANAKGGTDSLQHLR